jgi:hypothetical protein
MDEKRNQRKWRLSLRSLLVIIGSGLFLCEMLVIVWGVLRRHARVSDQLNIGRSLYMTLRSYAAETANSEQFPLYKVGRGGELLENSNGAFEVLLTRYMDEKRVLFNEESAWCKGGVATNEKTVGPGECEWAYVRGLEVSSNGQWPLLANAFAPGRTTYVADPAEKGGVHRGKRAVVILAGGSAEILETKKKGDESYVPRHDKPGADAFEKDGDWLAGERVKVLFPKE